MNPRIFFTALVVAAVAVFWACAATATATVAVTSEDEIYTGEIVASSSNSELDGAFVTVKCGSSQVKGAIETHGEGIAASGAVSSLTFSSCNYTVTVTSTGTLAATATSEGNGTLVSTGAAVSIATSIGTCVFTTNNTAVGSLTGSTSTNATWDLNSSKIPRTGGNFLCGSSGTWTGNYTVTTPEALALAPAPEKFHFGLEKNVVDIIGLADSPAQTFTFELGNVACEELETSGALNTIKNRSTSLPADPTFKKCKLGAEGATIKANKCTIFFVSGELNKGVPEGVVSIFCFKGESIEVSVKECLIEIPKQQANVGEGLKKVTYKTIGAGANQEVTAEFALTGIEYTETNEKCANNGKTFKNGQYTGSIKFKAKEAGVQKALFLRNTA
jgi:hypothetical protein